MTPTLAAAATKPASARGRFLRQVILWHWVSSGVCLGGMLLFTVTGVTLNHAGGIAAQPEVRRTEAKLPPGLVERLGGGPGSGRGRLPGEVARWVEERVGVDAGRAEAEWSESDVYVSLPRPGGDAWLSIDRSTGAVTHELTTRGAISFLNDLHKGRHTGAAWSFYIDALAAACVVFSISGLILLWTHAAKRPSTWPLVGFGVLLPVLIAVYIMHS